MKNYFLILMTVFVACNEPNTPGDCQPGFKPVTSYKSETKTKGISFTTDPRMVELSLGKFTSSHYPEAEAVADSALHIASVLLSSKDFKTAMAGMDFSCRNYDRNCSKNCQKCSDRFSGMVVLDSVYRKQQVKLDLYLQKCRNEFGHAWMNVFEIYSCQSVVFYDESKLSPAYCYAYHLAHEYMHIVGFFHTDHKDDVAEKVGWMGWEILLDWRKSGINVMQVKPGMM